MALTQPDLTEDEERRRWARVRELAPEVWETGQRILINIVSEGIKKYVGLSQ